MKSLSILLLGTIGLVGCSSANIEEAKTSFRFITMGGSLDEEVLVDPEGNEPSAPKEYSGELEAVPAPARLVYVEKTVVLKDVTTAKAYVLESKWHSVSLWLYPDGSYSTKDPQRTRGSWEEVHRVLTLNPEHGGRMVFSPDENGNYVPEDAGAMRLRKVLH